MADNLKAALREFMDKRYSVGIITDKGAFAGTLGPIDLLTKFSEYLIAPKHTGAEVAKLEVSGAPADLQGFYSVDFGVTMNYDHTYYYQTNLLNLALCLSSMSNDLERGAEIKPEDMRLTGISNRSHMILRAGLNHFSELLAKRMPSTLDHPDGVQVMLQMAEDFDKIVAPLLPQAKGRNGGGRRPGGGGGRLT